MSTMLAPLIPIPQTCAVTVDDIEYQQVAGVSLLARVYRPVGIAAKVAILDVHGGAWVNGDRTLQQNLCQAMASSGALVASIDFRQPPGNPYPTSLQDVNLGVRWLKQQAAALGVAPGAPTALSGGSSGGHVVILCGMRPRDPRYSALPLPGADGASYDARVAFVIADAPVTDPLARLQDAERDGRTDLVDRHHLYWPSEEATREGNPRLILERGEPVELPPLFVSQATGDQAVPVAGTRDFVAKYRAAGGEVEYLEFADLGHGFILQAPARAESVQQALAVNAFIQAHVAPAGR
jgi:acetyl esterase/lipase